MAYTLHCDIHGDSSASDILNLIESYTDNRFGKHGGTIICPTCKHPATIFKKYKLQEKGQIWECWIRQVVRIPFDVPTYVPYMFFITGKEASKLSDGIMISYYKDTRHANGGRLKHGHGPGGPAVLGRDELLLLIRYLVEEKLISVDDIENILRKMRAATA